VAKAAERTQIRATEVMASLARDIRFDPARLFHEDGTPKELHEMDLGRYASRRRPTCMLLLPAKIRVTLIPLKPFQLFWLLPTGSGSPEAPFERPNAKYLESLLAELDTCSMEDAARTYEMR
jgi:hypothetical protein